MGDEDPSKQDHSSSQKCENPDLEKFRRQWKVELGLDSKGAGQSGEKIDDESENDEDEEDDDDDDENEDEDEGQIDENVSVEEEAHDLFQRGVHCEKTGHFYDAIKFYKKALNMVPDIEHRFNQKQPVLAKVDQERRPSLQKPADVPIDDADEEDADMKERFLMEIEKNGWSWFEKVREDGKMHFKDLPEEVIKYIVRWVVSTDLDVRSLDVLASVSKGFFVICRDDRLWQAICERIWGKGKTYRSQSEFSSYREMFLTRARVRFDGCYISKITYIRSGENSFQDQSYRPWHLVEYYRYIFFTPNGQFFFLTTSEVPANTVPYLRDPMNQTKFNNLLIGHYTLDEHLVYGQCWNPTKIRLKNNSGSGNIVYNLVLQVLHVKKKFNSALHWIEYYVNIERESGIIKNEFDIEQVKFPNFFYSRVKSFTREAREALH